MAEAVRRFGAGWIETLPPELWQIILDFAPSATIRECLAVSKLLHDVAAPIVFSALRIHFGAWQADSESGTQWAEGDCVRRSCSMLLHIMTDPIFASYVKHLDVLAFVDKKATFELCCLTKALGVMHNLRTFRWHTGSRMFSIPDNELMKTLASTCYRLCEYSLPIQCLSEIHGLKQLRATSVSLQFVDTNLWHSGSPLDDVDLACFASLFDVYRGFLTQLSVPSQVVLECPVFILQHLTHLTIDCTEDGDFGSIPIIFGSCNRLESLHIQSPEQPPDDLFATMAESPSALPLLTHLKINVEFPWGETRYDALAGFIRSKKKLRCLDFGEASVYLTMLAPVLSAIESLSGLEVLGLDITVDAFGEAESAYLQRIIPKTVTALRLELGYTQPGMENALKPASPWIELWASLPRLAFAYLAGDDEQHCPTLSADELADAVASLRLIGCRWRFREVERVDGEVKMSEPWSQTKVRFRTVQDFGCEDWEWLMRDHGLLSDFSYAR
ncbi:uncharacterized protein C8Q71DRAFT_788665 [Rhodofomes roseus]|uniref:F-box domain-containing protein n=1 Tax=Rhodofomes roseus TaxID=34475 RepID=A0ABQ8JZR6_9APHY|nr:uncharacterized protein C8Q71DRAFT_788665 [Rhodofomes roseus]KAH9829829.1 hypothetical protein C8Q71DRAFT_788665 [Rhodofomes roseus]